MTPTKEEIIQNVYDNKLIAIVRGMEPEYCVKLAEALCEGGINMVEITFNQKSTDRYEATTKAIRAISGQLAGRVMVGAGTVLSKEQVDLAKEGYALVIVDAGAGHADLTEEYAAIPREMGEVAAFFGQEVLGQVTEEQLLAQLDAVRSALPGTYDLVLMDIQMPVMNGWQAAEAIRALPDPALSRIPIVALSANVFDSDIQRSMDAGMEAHLAKPIDVPVLLGTIRGCCGKTIKKRRGEQPLRFRRYRIVTAPSPGRFSDVRSWDGRTAPRAGPPPGWRGPPPRRTPGRE